MEHGRQDYSDLTLHDPYAVPLGCIDVSQPKLYETQQHWRYFERLRKEAPVHYCAESAHGAYWSITKFDDIVSVNANHDAFSSEPTASLGDDLPDGFVNFINMDPPKHDVQRTTVSPSVSRPRLEELEPLIRERTVEVLDSLPVGETFDWIDRVSIELTSRMLATLLDFPYAERRKLVAWSDITIASSVFGGPLGAEELLEQLYPCLEAFMGIWKERVAQPPKSDLISLMAHNPLTQEMEPMEFLGNLVLLIVGGSDTTRNSMAAGAVALERHQAERRKLYEDPGLIPNFVSETIRWQTPLAYMRRTAKEDVEVGGETIKHGDKVVMWYVSGNRDEDAFERADDFLIDRANARRHLSFGFGIHRCVGARLAELQLRVLWEEILPRFSRIEVTREPERICSNMIMGFRALPVRIHAR